MDHLVIFGTFGSKLTFSVSKRMGTFQKATVYLVSQFLLFFLLAKASFERRRREKSNAHFLVLSTSAKSVGVGENCKDGPQSFQWRE